MKKVIFGLACVALVGLSAPVFATPTVHITAPTLEFNVSGNPNLTNALNTEFGASQAYLNTELRKLEASTQKDLEGFGSQDDLAKGFGNANLYASQSSTLQGYQGYKLFSVSSGAMAGIQLPTSDFSKLESSFSNFEKDPDIYLGIAPSMSILNVGINAEKVFGLFAPSLGDKLKNFYFNVKFGGIGYNYSYNDGDTKAKIEMKSGTFGLGVNYQILPGLPSIAFGLFKWRGVSLGSGLTYQSNTITMTPTINSISQTYTNDILVGTTTRTVSATIVCAPKMKLEIDSKTFSIPLEATTSAQFLWLFNTNLGAGVDLVFGKSDINATADGTISINNITVPGEVSGYVTAKSQPGSVAIDASTKGKPSFLRARLMTGLGMNAGPLKIDVPVYFYPGSGYAFGLTAAFVW